MVCRSISLFPSLELCQHVAENVEEEVDMVFLENQRWSETNRVIATSTEKDTCHKWGQDIDINTVCVISLDLNTAGYNGVIHAYVAGAVAGGLWCGSLALECS